MASTSSSHATFFLEHGVAILWYMADEAGLLDASKKHQYSLSTLEGAGETLPTSFPMRHPLMRFHAPRQDVSLSNYAAGHLEALAEVLRLEIEDVITLAFCASLRTSEHIVPRDYIDAFDSTMKIFEAMIGTSE